MLTSRGWWFIFVTFLFLVVGVLVHLPPIVLISLSLLVWILLQWLWFHIRLRIALAQLSVERQLRDHRGVVANLWTRRSFTVRVRLRCDSQLSLPYVRIADRVPLLLKQVDGRNESDGGVSREQSLQMEYTVECDAAGIVRFEGLRLQIADLQGLFIHETFVSDVLIVRVLPSLAAVRSHIPLVKQHNMLPLLGQHAHRKAGSGSELLDLRDYFPGDPPKLIAWKASARRDRLMTKEFESEVPIRCTLFVDASRSVRVGVPGRNALARLIDIVAGVAQAASNARDLSGLCLFDEKTVRYVRPARSSRHLTTITRHLTEVACLPPTTGEASLAQLLPIAFGLAEELYPDLLRSDVNEFPFWLPLWAPQAAFAVPRPLLRAETIWTKPFVWLRRILRYLPFALWHNVKARFSKHYHRHFRWRKQLAAMLSVRYNLGPGGLSLLLENHRECVHYLQQFLAEHLVTFPLPLYTRRGQYQFAAPEKVEVLSKVLLRAVTRARDNELFVLLVDLLEIEDAWDGLLRAVKVALAKHHQVMLICPWPPGVPSPTDGASFATDEKPPVLPHSRDGVFDASITVQAMMRRATAMRLHRAFHDLRRAFTKLGVRVICAADRESVPLIMKKMEQLRRQERGFA